MLKSQTMTLKIGELEAETTRLKIKANDERFVNADPEKTGYEALMGEHRAVNKELGEKQSELLTSYQERNVYWENEAKDISVALASEVKMPSDMWTPELREFRELAQKVSIIDYFSAAERSRAATGAAGEYNEAVFGANREGDFPIEMLHEREDVLKVGADFWNDVKETEHRTALTGTGVNAGASTSYVSQLFSTTESAFMGASFPAVGVGDHSYPIFSKVTTAGDFARAGSEGTPVGSLTINTATNRRLQATMEITGEDENRIPNIAGMLVSHLRAQIQSELDEYGIDELVSAQGTLTDTTTDETLAAFLTRIGNVVDGLRARNIAEVRGLLGGKAGGTRNTVFGHIAGLTLASGGSQFTELPRLSDPNYFRASQHLPGTDAGDDGRVMFAGTSPTVNLRRFIVPIWRRGEILRDTGVGQLGGIRRYTIAMFAAVEITATDQHVYGTVHVS